jgi:hypothetical protein
VRVYKLKKKIEVTYDEFGHCKKEDGLGRGEEKISVSMRVWKTSRIIRIWKTY